LPAHGSLVVMHSRSPRARLFVLLLAAGLLTGLTATASAAAPTLPGCAIADTLTKHRTLSDWHRALLDQTYRLSSAHKPKDLRSTANAGLNSGYKVRKFVITDLKKMASAARRAGARFSVQSAYRSYATQKATFASWVRLHGYAVALQESARAGHSEHQLGTTLDLKSYRGKAPWDVADWGKTKAGKWLRANAWKYGFVMSYPKGMTTVTCYTYEPWHYRYVGRKLAKQVHDSQLTLREFLWARQTPVAPAPVAPVTPSPSSSVEPTPSETTS
jgi:zinc D-Ala-D-Ala carboxypeptidase